MKHSCQDVFFYFRENLLQYNQKTGIINVAMSPADNGVTLCTVSFHQMTSGDVQSEWA